MSDAPDLDHTGEFVNTVRVALRATPASVGVARRITRLASQRWHLDSIGHAAELTVSELIASAVRQRPDVPLVLRLSRLPDALIVAVSGPTDGDPDDDDFGARLLDRVSAGRGTLPLPEGTLAWVRLTTEPTQDAEPSA